MGQLKLETLGALFLSLSLLSMLFPSACTQYRQARCTSVCKGLGKGVEDLFTSRSTRCWSHLRASLFTAFFSPSNACWLLVHSAAPRGHINHSLVFCGDDRGEGAPLSRPLEQIIQLNNNHFLHCNPGNLFTLQSLLHCMASWGSDKMALLNPQETGLLAASTPTPNRTTTIWTFCTLHPTIMPHSILPERL